MTLAAVSVGLLGAGCGNGPSGAAPTSPPRDELLRLQARPGPSSGGGCHPGTHRLSVGRGREALLHVGPRGRSESRALLLALHGAKSGGARGGLWIFRRSWDQPGLVIVAPGAEGATWSLQADVRMIDRSLRAAFARCRIDPRRIAVGGFSAGASLSLLLGLANGDLFGRILAFSPAAVLPEERIGKPDVFVAHGRADEVIPIERGGADVARTLRRKGYDVTYRPFAGGHRLDPELAGRAVRSWLTPPRGS